MALINLTNFEAAVGSYIPILGQVIDFKREQQIDKAIVNLYDQTGRLALLTVQDITAFLWWAAHIANAALDDWEYASQIETALGKADALNMEAWQTWVNVKHPADLRALFDTLSAQLADVKKSIPKQQKVNLKPLEAEIAALQKWRSVTVNPTLKQWTGFYGKWTHTYLPPITTLTQWLHSPKTFAKWAIMPLISEAVSALKQPSAKSYATSIEATLAQTWANDPDTIYAAFLNWLVSGS